MQGQYTDDTVLTYRYLSIEIRYCFEITESLMFPRPCIPTYMQLLIRIGLQQTQFTGAGYSFGSPLDVQLIKNDPCVSLDRAQGEEKPLTDLAIGESLGNEP